MSSLGHAERKRYIPEISEQPKRQISHKCFSADQDISRPGQTNFHPTNIRLSQKIFRNSGQKYFSSDGRFFQHIQSRASGVLASVTSHQHFSCL